jgi:hypothetical protein
MKNALLIWIAVGLSLSLSGQELMTIGEVFNFDINDEFHFRSSLNGQPPNADRITILDKYYSQDGDTVYYVVFHDSYWTTIIWDPEPHLEYYFWTATTTLKYYNLNLSLYYYDIGFQDDTSILYIEYYCDSLINKCEYYIGGGFEPDFYRNSYGRGIGQVGEYMEYGGVMDPSVNNNLFYYKKNGVECGLPDTTMVGIKNNIELFKEFEIFPNPARSKLFISANNSIENFDLFLFNSSGSKIDNYTLFGNRNEINITGLERGIYFLEILYEDEIQSFKIIKK